MVAVVVMRVWLRPAQRWKGVRGHWPTVLLIYYLNTSRDIRITTVRR